MVKAILFSAQAYVVYIFKTFQTLRPDMGVLALNFRGFFTPIPVRVCGILVGNTGCI